MDFEYIDAGGDIELMEMGHLKDKPAPPVFFKGFFFSISFIPSNFDDENVRVLPYRKVFQCISSITVLSIYICHYVSMVSRVN